MIGYAIRRALLFFPTIAMVSIIVFSLLSLAPGDAATIIGQDSSPEKIEALRESLHLNDPIPVQYGRWLGSLVTGNLGKSIFTGRPVIQDITYRLPTTFELGSISLFLTAVVGSTIGMISAAKPESMVDQFSRAFAILGLSLPLFWVAAIVLVVPALRFHYSPPAFYAGPFENLADNLRILIPAGAVLALSGIGRISRLMRATMLDVMSQDYMRTARAKGLKESTVLLRHGLRNGLIPVVTLLGLEVPFLFGGAVIIEQVFAIPGMGNYLYDAINKRDIIVVMDLNMFISSIVLISSLGVDLTYGVIDPRMRIRG
ncbi:MAG: ABC transporter permease [Dehalococcoidia bacterium]